jgi:hypothetical protein
MRRVNRGIVITLVLGLASCLRASQEPVTYPAFAEAKLARTFQAGDHTVQIDEAAIAFGPAYFCAAAQGAPTECESAIAEIRRTTRIDLLSAARQPLGDVRGFTGSVRSVSYDLGLDWFDTQTAVTARPEAPGGHSVFVRGVASRAGSDVPFVATVDVTPQYQGQRAFSTAPAIADVTGANTRLVVSFDLPAWLGQVDFGALEAAPERPAIIAPGTKGHDAIQVGLRNLRPPEFHWETTP